MENDKAVFGVFKTRALADKAVAALKVDGFMNSEISVILPNCSGVYEESMYTSTKAPEGAATGASTGAVIGGALGLLAGIGALAIPGVGPLIAADVAVTPEVSTEWKNLPPITRRPDDLQDSRF